MNSEQKKRGLPLRSSFNVIDVAILLLILVCAVGIYMRYGMEKTIAAGEGEVYEIRFVCEDVRYTTANYVNTGDALFFTDNHLPFGTITDTVVIRPSSEEISVNGNNLTVYYPSDTIVDISGSVRVKGIMTENGFLIDGSSYIAPNTVIHISNKLVDLSVRVLSLTLVEGE